MGSRGGGGGSNGGGSQGIPAASKKMVQSLKEIVNGVPEAEIYSTLKDCNMDPNEAVNRLLSQDTFHEVKSKREKKKESKDTTEYRPRGGGSTSNRGGRSGTDRYAGRGGPPQFSSSESSGKSTYTRENGASSFTSSNTTASKVVPRTANWNPPTYNSDSHGLENEASAHNTTNSASVSVSQPSPYQSAWSSSPGQKSMADIVKMGKPQNRSYNYSSTPSNPPPPQAASHNPVPPPPTTVPSSTDTDWPSMEPPQPVNLHSVPDPQIEPEINSGNQSNLQFENNNEVEVQDEDDEEVYDDDHNEGNSELSVEEEEEEEEEDEEEEEEEEEEDAPVSSIQNHVDPPEEEDDRPSVVIPDHLQVHTADLSHLSFGSFGANVNQGYSGHFTSRPEEPVPATENYNLPSASQTTVEQENHEHELTRGNQYSFPPVTHPHTFENPQLSNPNFPQSQTQISTPFSNPVRESDLSSYSQFSVSQPMPARYASSASPINDPTISMAEALKNVRLTSSSSQQTQHTLPTAVPQHLTVHPYSQPTLPLPFTNMISYPFLPQSYTYMPSGFQPAFSPNSTYHQQLAAMLPQYKNSISNNLPQSGAIPSGYSSFGNSTGVPGNYEDVLNAHYKDTNSQLLSLQQNEWVHGGGSRTMAVPASGYYSLQGQNQQQQAGSGFRQGQQPAGYGGAGVNYPDFFQSQAQEHQLQQNARDGGAQGQQKLQSQQLWQNGY